jgi:hypothetical protein
MTAQGGHYQLLKSVAEIPLGLGPPPGDSVNFYSKVRQI